MTAAKALAAGRAKESLKSKSELCPLLQKQGFQRRQKRGGQDSGPRRTRRRLGSSTIAKFTQVKKRVCLQCESEDFKSNKGAMGEIQGQAKKVFDVSSLAVIIRNARSPA